MGRKAAETLIEANYNRTRNRPVVALGRWSEADAADSESQLDEHNPDAELAEELMQLALLTNGQPTDSSRPSVASKS